MKTDLEKFIELYALFGIELTVIDTNDNPNMKRVDLKPFSNDKLNGYKTCFSEVFFSNEGKFIEQSFWEE